MITRSNRAAAPDPNDRAALAQSERQAAETGPGSFSDPALTEKIVEVLPLGQAEAPIRGLDPTPAR